MPVFKTATEQPYIDKIYEIAELEVWLVDGKYVRDNLDIDFTQGGHHLRYNFIPDNEIWIDNSVEWREWQAVFIHELVEHDCMLKGLDYEACHNIANIAEKNMRISGVRFIKRKPLDTGIYINRKVI